jgi:hypothetical protein
MVNGRPAFQISSKCEILRSGFNGDYYYHKLNISYDNHRYREEPEKNMSSHPHDGLQYIALYYAQYFDYVKEKSIEKSYKPQIIY